MKVVYTELFASKVGRLGNEPKGPLKEAVEMIIKNPGGYDGKHRYPWPGCFEKKVGPYRIVYGICGECRKQGFGSQHTECSGYGDDTIVFRTAYVMF
ncbi:MAG: type II toxin-antitoxin system RelE/ParE family toxin [Candidatus Polarisedimenticolia bacterium]